MCIYMMLRICFEDLHYIYITFTLHIHYIIVTLHLCYIYITFTLHLQEIGSFHIDIEHLCSTPSNKVLRVFEDA